MQKASRNSHCLALGEARCPEAHKTHKGCSLLSRAQQRSGSPGTKRFHRRTTKTSPLSAPPLPASSLPVTVAPDHSLPETNKYKVLDSGLQANRIPGHPVYQSPAPSSHSAPRSSLSSSGKTTLLPAPSYRGQSSGLSESAERYRGGPRGSEGLGRPSRLLLG